MNMDVYTAIHEERLQEMQTEAQRRRLLRDLPHRRALGRRAAGRLGSMLIAAGSRLEQFEHGKRPEACEVVRSL